MNDQKGDIDARINAFHQPAEEKQPEPTPSSNETTEKPQPQEEQVDPEQYPPEDNTIDDASQESDTPDLDAEVEKYTSLLNKGKGK